MLLQPLSPLAFFATGWSLVQSAQGQVVDDKPSRNVHAAVAFIRSGERTPLISRGAKKLSALGAQQMYTLGQNLRGRYMGDGTFSGLGHDPIPGLAEDILDPRQLYIQTLDKPHLQASAQALLQGLYPPYSLSGGFGDFEGVLANGSVIEAPLGGYQYPPIKVEGERDPWSIYLGGGENCPVAMQEALGYMTTDEYADTRWESMDFYQSLDKELFGGAYREREISYFNALPIYDYLSYANTHNSTIRSLFSPDSNSTDSQDSGVLSRLKNYADTHAWYSWGNASAPSSRDNNTLQAIPGRTLAALILGQLQKTLANNGSTTNGQSQPLTLLFGDHEPFISLFSLMGLDAITSEFRAVPPFGSAMVFELFSMGQSPDFPEDPADLWIDFSFQNGSDFRSRLVAYPIFRNGRSRTDISWLEFERRMQGVMVNEVGRWCSLCDSSAIFCQGAEGSNEDVVVVVGGRRGKGDKVSPAVAGVIGAVVTLFVAAAVFALAMLFGGVRFRRVDKRREAKNNLGGFKGSSKLASDPDVSLARNGAIPAGIGAGATVVQQQKPGHERVGSWELRQKERGARGGEGDLADETMARSERGSFEEIEAAMGRAVEPVERV